MRRRRPLGHADFLRHRPSREALWLHHSRGRMDLRAGAGLSRLLCQRLKTTELEQLGSLRGVRACVFDAYGTLFDFGSTAKQCRDALGDHIERLTKLWRDKQLEYTWLRAAQGRHADFWQVTGDALDFSLETLNLEAPAFVTASWLST